MNDTQERSDMQRAETDETIIADTATDINTTPPAEDASAHEETPAEMAMRDPSLRELTPEEEVQRAAVEQKINALEVEYRRKPFYEFVKRCVDIALSFTGLLVLSPVFLVIAILIKCDDGGKVFYKHKRIGRGGKTIYIHKFRSMRKDADKLIDQLTPEQLHQYYTEFKIDNDPRITKIGNFLRRTSLDELPQVIDIFTGKLSIIGPRPLVDVETEQYYNKRELFLSVKPGLTGYWQAYARNDVGYSDGARQEMELCYVEKRSLWFDTKIFFKTIFSVLGRKGAK